MVKEFLRRGLIVAVALLLVTFPVGADAAAQASSTAAAGPQTDNAQSEQGAKNDSAPPDAPSTSQTGNTQPSPDAKPKTGTQGQQPVGTAAAGMGNTAGVAASKPAGIAMAPPKQRRVRLLVVKLGTIMGAGAALGTVVALSKASPSRPPGAH